MNHDIVNSLTQSYKFDESIDNGDIESKDGEYAMNQGQVTFDEKPLRNITDNQNMQNQNSYF